MRRMTDQMGCVKIAKWCFFLLSFLGICSCSLLEKEKINSLVVFWEGRIIQFPQGVHFTSLKKDTLDFPFSDASFTIVSYVDSIGCTSCKLQLSKWKSLIQELDSVSNEKIPVLIFMHPKKEKDVMLALKRDNFNYPVCIDMEDAFNKLNKFSTNMSFQTFLVDKKFKIIAIGNPVLNPKVKELYLKIIQGEKIEQKNESRVIRTKVDTDKTSISLGAFNWQKEQKVSFTLKNTGNKLLIIEDVNTSCGCTSVAYSQEPVQPGKVATLDVIYKAEHPEHFSKTITVYCNTESSPITLKISGNAK